jgi:predicted nucleic acid-binding protein
MINEFVFLDTSFFKAFVDAEDDFHSDAVRILQNLEQTETTLITTNYILDETVTLIRAKCGLPRVKNFREALVKLSHFKIYRVFATDEEKAWDWFWNDWSKLSFTDCTSFAVMKRLGLIRVATFDSHFSSAGFKIEK